MDMQRSLAVIRAAALEAGKVISDHFYQAGGPQGHDGHCVADEEAERIIRRHLQLHLPECSIIGEELSSLDRLEKGEYLILVDPNDGTSAFKDFVALRCPSACYGTVFPFSESSMRPQHGQALAI